MSVTNRDASLLTKRRQAKALASFANAVQDANNALGGFTTVRRTQPTDQMAVVKIEQNLGKCYCTQDADPATRYSFNPSGGVCGCGLGGS